MFRPDKNPKQDNLYHSKENREHCRTQVCICCYKGINLVSVAQLASDCRIKLSRKKLCFNCTGSKHRASEHKSTKTCQQCQGKHDTSLCEKQHMLLTTNHTSDTKPVLVVEVEGIKCYALIDTGGGELLRFIKPNKQNKKESNSKRV